MKHQLEACRALDLTDERGALCGAILAQLGVDVIKVEEPGGEKARRLGPFIDDLPHPERSLGWIAFNVNKRGVTLNLESETGKNLFRKLVVTADFVIESSSPGRMGNLGLDYPSLKGINPNIIVTSITPFGQTGPYADYQAGDLTVTAMGGFVYSTGDPDRPPVRISADQAYLHASAYAAMATQLAHRFREMGNGGQHIDVSAQEAIAITLGEAVPVWELFRADYPRSGGVLPGLFPMRIIYPCKDGLISFMLQPGRVSWAGIVEWMMAEDETREQGEDLQRRMKELHFATASHEVYFDLQDAFARFFATKTRTEIWDQARRRRFAAAPICSVRDNLSDDHLKARDFLAPLDCPGSGHKLVYPRYLYASNGPARGLPEPAPRIGEHNLEVYRDELGLTRQELERLASSGVI